ncbi:MAG: hypothetical protein M1816_000918 [Peltula sp. TS41687]|nr:MAG: hypothetical protein M1816_000918 [Peltula sp. TS41687]
MRSLLGLSASLLIVLWFIVVGNTLSLPPPLRLAGRSSSRHAQFVERRSGGVGPGSGSEDRSAAESWPPLRRLRKREESGQAASSSTSANRREEEGSRPSSPSASDVKDVDPDLTLDEWEEYLSTRDWTEHERERITMCIFRARRFEGFVQEYLRLVQVECALQVVKDRGGGEEEWLGQGGAGAEGEGGSDGVVEEESPSKNSLGQSGERLMKAVVGGITQSTKKGGWWLKTPAPPVVPLLRGMIAAPL